MSRCCSVKTAAQKRCVWLTVHRNQGATQILFSDFKLLNRYFTWYQLFANLIFKKQITKENRKSICWVSYSTKITFMFKSLYNDFNVIVIIALAKAAFSHLYSELADIQCLICDQKKQTSCSLLKNRSLYSFRYRLSTMTKLKNMTPARRRFLFTMPILSVPFSPLRSVLE